MTLDDLLKAHCRGTAQRHANPRPAAVAAMLPLVEGWELVDDGKAIQMKRRCDGFLDAAQVLVKIAALADEEDHHPDARIYSYRWLELTLPPIRSAASQTTTSSRRQKSIVSWRQASTDGVRLTRQ